MKKRIASLVLALVLVLGLATTASAGDGTVDYPHLYAGENGIITSLEPEDNPPLSQDYTGQGWSWNAATYTLTLDNVSQPSLSLSIVDPEKPVTIVVKGTNNLYSISEYAEVFSKTVTSTLTGSGTLNLTGGGSVDVVDGPTVNSVGTARGDSIGTLKSGTVSTKSQLSSKISIQGGCLIVDAREWLEKYAYTEEYRQSLNSAVCASLYQASEDYLQNCVIRDENGKPVTVKKVTIVQPPYNDSYYMVAVKEDGTPATYVKIMAPGYTPFADVAPSAYYADPVMWAVDEGITNGTSTTTFSPNDTCTRGQIITFLWRAAGSPAPSGTANVSDAGNTYYTNAVLWAAENGLFSGSTFSPDAPCTREMAVEFMWKHAGSPDAAAATFTDVSSPAVNWAVANGVTNGTSTTFSPNDTCTRGQIVTFLYRAFA